MSSDNDLVGLIEMAGGTVPPGLCKVTATPDGLQLWQFPTAAVDSVVWWRHLAALHPKTGWWPFMSGIADERDQWACQIDSSYDPSVALTLAGSADVTHLSENWCRDRGYTLEIEDAPVQMFPETADSPIVAADAGLITLMRVSASWQIPAVGGWLGTSNASIPGWQVSAQLREWEQQYGAVISACTADTIELWVDRPPNNTQRCVLLATDMANFCPDIVEQGLGTVNALASVLATSSKWWYLWWD